MGAFSESGWKWSKSLRALARLAIAALVLLAASPAQAQLSYVDVKTGFALWLPTGRYTPGGKDNSGQGQWGYEPTLGVTVWFDKDRQNRHLNLATMAFYDLYSPRRGTIGPSDTKLKTGNILTLMGGLGYQLRKGRLNIGVPCWAQWKVTEDRLPPGVGPILPGIQAAKDRSFGVGGETDFNWNPTNGITLRFFQGFGGINTTTGQSFFFFYHHIFGAQGGP
jgi:hypothetical protein